MSGMSVTEQGFVLYRESNSFRAFVDMMASHVINGDLAPRELSMAVAVAQDRIWEHLRRDPSWKAISHAEREINRNELLEKLNRTFRQQIIFFDKGSDG